MGTHTTTATREELNPKAMARRQALKRQQKLALAWVQQASRAIQQRVLNMVEFQAAGCVACYLALPREAQTQQIVDACRQSGKRLAVPAYDRAHGRYGLSWLDPDAPVHAGDFGITEPTAPRWAAPGDIELIIVPCVAFDEYGRRLGHGGGHFDRMLGRHRGLKICLAFEGQRLTAAPFEPHDVPVDLVVTEAKVYDARGS